jgi:histidyl-tRNA synthetase
VKLYYFSPHFRYERPQAGRFREFHQFGCEAIGEADAFLDAEVIDMSWQFLKSLGLQNTLLFINSIGCPECRPKYLEVLQGLFHQPYRRTLSGLPDPSGPQCPAFA